MRLQPVILALLLSVAGAGTAETPPDPRRKVVAELSTLLDREPHHVGALYYGARLLAGLGDQEAALAWLDRLEPVGLGDELDPDDFGALAATEAFRVRAARFATAAPPIGRAQLRCEIQGRDFLPEGTAWDPKRNEVLISSGRRRTVIAVTDTGRCRDVVPPADDGLLAVLGMTVDATHDVLWVASSAAPFMQGAKPGDTGARLSRIDLAAGRVVQSYPLPGPVLLNDVALAADGSVYVSESNTGTVYRLAPGAAALQPVLPAGSFEGTNGLVVLAEGSLLVADFHGLHLVTAPAGPAPRTAQLATPEDLYLGGIDGLARAGDHVIAIQNLVGRSRIWRLAIDAREPGVTTARVLLRGHPDFLNPTTGVVVGQQFLFLADPKLQRALPDGTVSPLPAGRTGHRLLALDCGAPD